MAMAAEKYTEDQISPRNFQRLSDHIYDYSGIKMPVTKRTMLEGRLRRRLRVTGHATLDAYCTYLFDDDGLADEGIALIDAVTTNKTDFYREAAHFGFMTDVAIPALLERGTRKIRAWSSACSTGAEPYTMAMVLQDAAGPRKLFDYSILATDLSTEVLEAARLGIYPDDFVQAVPALQRKRYVMSSVNPKARRSRISPALRAKVGYARLNLMDSAYQGVEPQDLIFCRNVLIYFDKKTQAQVLQRLCDRLAPGGYLFIGHSESIAGLDLPVRPVSGTVFIKE